MERLKRRLENRRLHTTSAGQVEVTFYTDPLCCWSWAWEAEREKLNIMLGEQAIWHLRMGGLIPDWAHFLDETNAIVRPAQMGPIWLHAGQIANKSIFHQIWHMDPPSTSWPACIAVKCAQLQSPKMGFLMLRQLQTLCMEKGYNVAKKEVIIEAGHLVADENPIFNPSVFVNDFATGNGQLEFRADLDATSKYKISRFPSLIIRANAKTILIPGFRDAYTIFTAIKNMVPVLEDCS